MRWFVTGPTKALEWCLTGRVFPAADAEGTGLFNYLLPEAEVLPKARRLSAIQWSAVGLSRIASRPSQVGGHYRMLQPGGGDAGDAGDDVI